MNSKDKEVVVIDQEKYAQLEDSYKRVVEHNKVLNSTVCDLDISLQAARSERDNLSTEVEHLKEELQCRAASLIFEKTYSMDNMRRKALERPK